MLEGVLLDQKKFLRITHFPYWDELTSSSQCCDIPGKVPREYLGVRTEPGRLRDHSPPQALLPDRALAAQQKPHSKPPLPPPGTAGPCSAVLRQQERRNKVMLPADFRCQSQQQVPPGQGTQALCSQAGQAGHGLPVQGRGLAPAAPWYLRLSPAPPPPA